MNYRHSFHAGNFADLVKHALALFLLAARQARGPVTVLETHAGAGLYDLTGDAARSREAEAGIAALMTRVQAAPPPTELVELAARVRAFNPGTGPVRVYPGSPVLMSQGLRRDDGYIGFELRPDIQALLATSLKPWPQASARLGDGYEEVLRAMSLVRAPLVLIDPPYERPDDYVRSAETARAILSRDADAVVAVWTPLKDLETFDGFLRRLEPSGPVLIAEARLRPLSDPMRMNGCAMVILNPPADTGRAAQQICDWVATHLGDEGGRAQVWTL